MSTRLPYVATIFASAFLLFLVQPIVAKQILPWFGGSAAVWTTCVFFFQLLLLAGYAYAHLLVRVVPSRAQLWLHLGLLALSLAVLPIVAQAGWKPSGAEDPSGRILGLLLATVGLPYFLLSTTSPLVQAWYARRFHSPYRLFALSNVASLAALLCYPFVVEPLVATRAQAVGWSWGYAAFAVLCGATAIHGRRAMVAGADPAGAAVPAAAPPRAGTALQWVALPALASLLLVAVTNHLTQNVASIPFLWILPLSLYLLTFIVCFDGRGWYRRGIFLPLAGLAVAGMAWMLTSSNLILNLKLTLPVFAAGLFVLCMLCHGELVRTRPEPARLTGFYLLISLGGALGSLLASVIAPRALPGDFEIAAGLALAAVVLVAKVAPAGRVALVGALAATAVTGYGVVSYVGHTVSDTRVLKRNFYSSLRTLDEAREGGMVRKLLHGTINHGEQFVEPARRRQAIAYFGPNSGIVLALEGLRRPQMRVGIVGLGAGTMAAWGRRGDVYRFYEINPQVIELAQSEFSYLADSAARIELVLGDGRLALEREPPQGFDLLAADAFSSDSVPMHLITREALVLYARHVRPGGVIVFNVTNRYLDLAPVVQRLAESLGLHARVVSHTPDDVEWETYSSTEFVLVTADPALFEGEALAEAASRIEVPRGVSVWTDDFNNLFQALR